MKEYPELSECVDSVALHYYEGGIELVDHIKAEFPDMPWNFTEGGPRLYDNYDTDWVKWSLVLARTLAYGGESFCGWNLLLDEDGGPNVGPFSCGGLVTLHSQTGELSYSGQYHALKHFSKFIRRGAQTHKAKLSDDFSGAFAYPSSMTTPVDVVAADNIDGSHVVVLVNSANYKRQAQYHYGDQWWYVEMMPNSVSTLYFEK